MYFFNIVFFLINERREEEKGSVPAPEPKRRYLITGVNDGKVNNFAGNKSTDEFALSLRNSVGDCAASAIRNNELFIPVLIIFAFTTLRRVIKCLARLSVSSTQSNPKVYSILLMLRENSKCEMRNFVHNCTDRKCKLNVNVHSCEVRVMGP